MKELNIKIESKEIKSSVRSLRSKWSYWQNKRREMVVDMDKNFDLSSFENYFIEHLKRENRKKSIKNIFPG
jgi:hypothetical protein